MVNGDIVHLSFDSAQPDKACFAQPDKACFASLDKAFFASLDKAFFASLDNACSDSLGNALRCLAVSSSMLDEQNTLSG
ncbi:hypothetical protein [Dyadobacter crusticola]|uniref:hypothetical protein n=1 Tax=Dyadobacter crusticola TaxID=292407 RepID=UPI0004E188EE|nr:hypothetical protein [Dyadobacter crusticola]